MKDENKEKNGFWLKDLAHRSKDFVNFQLQNKCLILLFICNGN